MKLKHLYILVWLCTSVSVFSQVKTDSVNVASTSVKTDSVPYSREYEFKEGLYLNLTELKQNAPIMKSQILFKPTSNGLDYWEELLSQKEFLYKNDDGKDISVQTNDVLIICNNRNLYIRFKDSDYEPKLFHQLTVIGTLCLFTANAPVPVFYKGQDAMIGRKNPDSTFDKMLQFIVDTETQTISGFNKENMEEILVRDAVLYSQFKGLKNNKKKKLIFVYLRKYNEKYPLYLSSK